MTAPTLPDRRAGAEALLRPLAAQVPGLASALDEELTARHIEQTLLVPGGQVHWVTPGAFWYRPDGSCSFRYRVAVSAGTAEVTEHTVLARVYPSDEVADRCLTGEVLGPAPHAAPPFPWRRWTTTRVAPRITLYLFPADPAHPTLARAMDLAALRGEDWPCKDVVPISVELVHLSRQGAPVLRYGVRRTGSTPTSPSSQVYGKIYPDTTTGEHVHRFLRSCARPGRIQIPTPLGYGAGLNLLLTDALPGQPVLPSIVRTAGRVGMDSPTTPTGGSARDTVRSTGRALAALHQSQQATAPVQTPRQLARDLDIELNLVQQVWPRTADRVRSLLDRLSTKSEGSAQVLCHGDFTPSQVLIDGHTVCGIVDFDTVCWGDAAMDLGRFLAHLDLLVTKELGQSAQPLREHLAHSLLAGYRDVFGVAGVDQSLLGRAALFRSMSLASTALHACRQLKERRMSLALSLLSTAKNGRTTS